LILASTKPNAWILDPFTGSSTTGIAANLANRRFLGIDQEQEFLEISKKRKIEISDLKTANSYRDKIKGFIDKKAVLKEYNEGIGATIGKVNDLNSAEQALIDNGDNYLKLMLLKAKAEFAFKKAAEQSYEIAKKQGEN
jgi:hypothetical protein